MPIEVGIWRIDGGVRRLALSPLHLEALLEEAIEKDASILGLELLVIGRQVKTEFGSRIDLLALDGDGDLYVIELKRDRTPREVIAQALEYGSWARGLGYEEIAALFREHSQGRHLEEVFAERFGQRPPDALNENHHLVVVASELDNSTERILTYLTDAFGVPINAVFFRHFEDGDRRYLARSWLIEPDAVEASADQSAVSRLREPWNGQDFYVAVGGDEHRSWEDMRRYGFVSAGGGSWYWKTLSLLSPGKRIFAYLPQTGYVGVGIVEEPVRPISEFSVEIDGRTVPLLQAPLVAKNMGEFAADPERGERVVRVKWIKAVPRDQAVWEKGMFATQNSAARLRNRFTLERLADRFRLDA